MQVFKDDNLAIIDDSSLVNVLAALTENVILWHFKICLSEQVFQTERERKQKCNKERQLFKV